MRAAEKREYAAIKRLNQAKARVTKAEDIVARSTAFAQDIRARYDAKRRS